MRLSSVKSLNFPFSVLNEPWNEFEVERDFCTGLGHHGDQCVVFAAIME